MTTPLDLESLVVVSVAAMFGYSLTNIAIEIALVKCRSSKSKVCKRLTLAYLKLIARIKKGEVVALESITNKVYYSIAYPSKYVAEEKWTFIHYIDQLGYIILLPDGRAESVDRLYGYIKFWLPINKEDRCFMVLQGAKNFEF